MSLLMELQAADLGLAASIGCPRSPFFFALFGINSALSPSICANRAPESVMADPRVIEAYLGGGVV